MSILNVDKIQPIGGGSTITVDATDIQASTGTIRASTFSGDVSATGIGVTSLNVTGVTTSTTFVGALTGNVTGNATGLSGTPNISAGTIAGSTGTFTGDVDIADKIVHTGDTNTAIRFPAADTITAETGGAEALRILSSTAVIVAGTSAYSDGTFGEAKLQFNTKSGNHIGACSVADSTNSVTHVLFKNPNGAIASVGTHNSDFIALTGNAERLRIDSSGRILIGTSTQNNNAALQVTTTNQVVATFEGTGVSDPQIYVGDNMASPTDNCIILGYDKADNRGYLTVGGDGDNVFTVTNGGAIGIGIANPSNKLEISGGNVRCLGTASARFTTNNGSAEGYFGWSSGTLTVGQAAATLSLEATGSNHIQLKTNGTEALRIDSSQRVMIGQGSAYAATGTGNMMLTVTKNATNRTDAAISNQSSGDNASAAVVLATHGQDYILEATGSGNTTDGVRAFRILKGTSERLRIDSSGHLLLGTSTGGLTDYGDSLTIADANAGMTLRCASTTQVSHIYFADGTSSTAQYAGYVQYNHSSDAMKFGTGSVERMIIDSNGNLKQGTSNPGPFTSTSPTNGLRFLGNKVMQGSVSSTTTLNGSGAGTFDLGKLWTTDDTSIELFIQVVRNDSGNYTTHYAKAFINKVRGAGMSQGHILYQNGAAQSNGFSITGISAGGYTGSGGSSHGTQITVTGGAGGVIYRATCFYTAISKNAQWS